MGAGVCVGEPQNINYCFSANGGGGEREREINYWNILIKCCINVNTHISHANGV